MSGDRELWREYRRTKDQALRDRLIETHLHVVKVAAAWLAGRLPSQLRLDDLYAAGTMGFLDAVEHYDPDRGVEFGAYATPRIRGAILDDLRRLDMVPRRVRRGLRDAETATASLYQRLHREPTEPEVAAELGIGIAEYHRLLNEGVRTLSLDAPGPESGVAPLDVLDDPETLDASEQMERTELRTRLASVIDRVSENERTVLALYYYEELSMQEIGEVLGVTESRVSQIHSAAIVRMRALLRRETGVARVGAR